MLFAKQKEVPFWSLISTPLTNLSREDDSSANSTPNLEIIESMVNQGGWSSQFPAAIVSMQLWPFQSVRNGCSAQAYLDAEMQRRKDVFDNLVKGAKDEHGRFLLKAFIDLYCYQDKEGKDVLHGLTLKNAFWVHSGHQRTQFVFLNAYVAYLTRLKARSEETKKEVLEDMPTLAEFALDIPAVIGTYVEKDRSTSDILREISRDQISINMAAGKQNVPKLKDAIKVAVLEIGDSLAPMIKERPFRALFSLKDGGSGDNSGAMPRHAYKLALINWFYAGTLKFVDKLFAQPKIEINGEKNQDNPNYIALSEVALSHEDPMSDASVISRLMEPSLEMLKSYVTKYGHKYIDASKIKPGDKDPVSAIEYEIFDRGTAWSLEEATEWVRSKCKGAGIGVYKAPVSTPKDTSKLPAAVVTSLNQTVTSDRTPTAFREFVGKFTGTPTAAGKEVNTNADAKAQELKGPLDAIWTLGTSDFEKLLLKSFEVTCQLKEGNPPAFEALVNEFAKLVELHTSPLQENQPTA